VIGVVIPAHNEAQYLAPCLVAAATAARHVALKGETVHIVVVLDNCTDESAQTVRNLGIASLCVRACNVGVARAAGATHLLDLGARWLSFTDADSRVAPDWLVAQLVLGAEVVCGSVEVMDWDVHCPHVRDAWRTRYCDADGHRHVHGANLGVCAQAYRRVGGFAPLACGEDVALVESLVAIGASIAWSAAPRVMTSARTKARVLGGFGETLASWARELELADLRAAGGQEARESQETHQAESR
jgi:glycosyltransferase involved in cell wall biosynthesis